MKILSKPHTVTPHSFDHYGVLKQPASDGLQEGKQMKVNKEKRKHNSISGRDLSTALDGPSFIFCPK